MANRLEGRVAVVTGGGDGLGRSIGLALAAEGAKIVVADFNKEAADKVVAEVKKAGSQAVPSYESVATMVGGANIIKAAITNFGKLDILINCAGNFKPIKTVDITEADFDSIMNVHVKGCFATCKAAIPEMIKNKFGRIINTSSRASAWGTASIAYAAAKASIMGISSMLAQEQKENGITVNVMFPSASTKLFPRKSQAGGPKMADNMPFAQGMEPDYCAPIVTYLCLPEAQNYTDKYFYTAGGDIAFYQHPLMLSGISPVLLRKPGMWTVDELVQIVPQVLGQS